MSPKITFLLVVSILMFSLELVSAQEPPSVESLKLLSDMALAGNQELKASEARWQMFRSRILHEGRLEDPVLTLKLQNGIVKDPFNFKKDPMTQKVVGISQQLPFWGKRKLRSEVAAKEAESYRWLYEERKLELRKMVAENYYQLYFTDRSLDVVERNIAIIKDFVELAQTRYSVGKGVQQDVFKAQVEQSKLLDAKISLEQRRKSLQAALNALLYRPADTAVGGVADFEITPMELSMVELQRIAQENRPMLRNLEVLIEKGRAAGKLAAKDFYPDFELFAEYMQRDSVMEEEGLDMYTAGVSFNLPVFRHHRKEMVAEADSSVRMATAELEALRTEIRSDIFDILARMEKSRNLAVLYRTGIIPQARQSLESAVIGYRVGSVDFLALLDSQMTLLNYEREYHSALADHEMGRAELEALVGRELE